MYISPFTVSLLNIQTLIFHSGLSPNLKFNMSSSKSAVIITPGSWHVPAHYTKAHQCAWRQGVQGPCRFPSYRHSLGLMVVVTGLA
ncbi:hypothetical protein BDV06DRAFT_191547 [Aspergillus oleicola]